MANLLAFIDGKSVLLSKSANKSQLVSDLPRTIFLFQSLDRNLLKGLLTLKNVSRPDSVLYLTKASRYILEQMCLYVDENKIEIQGSRCKIWLERDEDVAKPE